jgi:hypothetical protein
MTDRKPPGTNWETWVEAQIRVAIEEGAFDNLPGAGKPLPNLDQEDPLSWWVKQLAQREQISVLPPSLALLRKVEMEIAAIEQLHDEATVRCRVVALNVEIAKVNATVVEGPPTRLGTLDVEQVVAQWRRTALPPQRHGGRSGRLGGGSNSAHGRKLGDHSEDLRQRFLHRRGRRFSGTEGGEAGVLQVRCPAHRFERVVRCRSLPFGKGLDHSRYHELEREEFRRELGERYPEGGVS